MYSELQNQHENVNIIEGLQFENLATEGSLIIVDDQMNDCVKSSNIQEYFVKKVHHRSVSIIFLCQNLFPQGKFGRDIRLNVHYIVIFKSPSLNSQVRFLGRQIFPNSPTFLPDAYKQATELPFSYILVSLHPECNEALRVRTGILPNEQPFVFIPL